MHTESGLPLLGTVPGTVHIIVTLLQPSCYLLHFLLLWTTHTKKKQDLQKTHNPVCFSTPHLATTYNHKHTSSSAQHLLTDRQTKIPLVLFHTNLTKRFGAGRLTLASSNSFNYIGKDQETRVPKLSHFPSVHFFIDQHAVLSKIQKPILTRKLLKFLSHSLYCSTPKPEMILTAEYQELPGSGVSSSSFKEGFLDLTKCPQCKQTILIVWLELWWIMHNVNWTSFIR